MTRIIRESTARLVEHTAEGGGLSDELRTTTHCYIAYAAMFFLLPFSINNFYQNKASLGCGSLFIVLTLLYNCRSLGQKTKVSYGLSRFLILTILTYIFCCFQQNGAVTAYWCYPAVIVIYFILPECEARAFNLLALATFFPQLWKFLTPEMAARATVTLLLVSVFSGVFIHLLGQQQAQLRDLAVRDPLTGVFNRLLLDTFLERTILLSERHQQPASLIYLDLDHFKDINDTFGHEMGDQVLQEIGELLMERVRRSDAVFRLGGEEFLLLLLDADLENARTVAEQLRSKVSQTIRLSEHTVTASLGVATLRESESWQDWLKRSDEAVYRAKQSGRNRVEVSAPKRARERVG